MVKLCVCIETVFENLDYLEKIKKIAELGFTTIEFWLWDSKDIKQLAKMSKELNITISDMVINTPDGNVGGSLVNPDERQKYLKRLRETILVAKELSCKKLITCSGNKMDNLSLEEQIRNVTTTLKEAVKIAKDEGIILLLEPLNSRVDHKGYFLDFSQLGFDIVKEIDSPNLKLLYDIYHMQLMEGNILNTIKKNIGLIGHFHSAGVPGRHELYTGEINYRNIVQKIDEMGYEGYFGLEYFPIDESEESLRKTRMLLV